MPNIPLFRFRSLWDSKDGISVGHLINEFPPKTCGNDMRFLKTKIPEVKYFRDFLISDSNNRERKCCYRLIPIIIRFVRSFHRNTDVLRLIFGKNIKLNADLFQMQTCNFFIEMFWKCVDFLLIFIGIVP